MWNNKFPVVERGRGRGGGGLRYNSKQSPRIKMLDYTASLFMRVSLNRGWRESGHEWETHYGSCQKKMFSPPVHCLTSTFKEKEKSGYVILDSVMTSFKSPSDNRVFITELRRFINPRSGFCLSTHPADEIHIRDCWFWTHWERKLSMKDKGCRWIICLSSDHISGETAHCVVVPAASSGCWLAEDSHIPLTWQDTNCDYKALSGNLPVQPDDIFVMSYNTRSDELVQYVQVWDPTQYDADASKKWQEKQQKIDDTTTICDVKKTLSPHITCCGRQMPFRAKRWEVTLCHVSCRTRGRRRMWGVKRCDCFQCKQSWRLSQKKSRGQQHV